MSKYEELNELRDYMHAFRQYPILRDRKKVAQLIKRWRNHKDRQAYDQLVYGNSRLIVSIALKYLSQGVSLIELVQEGFIGMMRAVDNFDPKQGSLSTYATLWIKSSIIRQIPDIGARHPFHVPVHTHKMVGVVARALTSFFHQHNRWPEDDQELHAWIRTTNEAAEATKLSKSITMKNVKLCLRLLNAKYCSLDAPLTTNAENNGRALLGDVIADIKMDVEKIAENQERLNKIKVEINKLEPRTRQIIYSRWLEEMTLEEISKRFGLTRERIRQIEVSAIEKIKRGALKRAKEVCRGQAR